ncbi:ABC transporter permease [Consotaella aegiceratis]|uniref:ABC transporter permease n=1 Tax=Consotaella aegiceratis TaxID=3097961 RepID=UPI002F41165D
MSLNTDARTWARMRARAERGPRRPLLPGRLGRFVQRRPLAALGAAFLLALLLIAIFAPWIAPYAPDDYADGVLVPPSWAHPFGIDHLGRDVFSRVIWGSRISLWMGFLAVIIAVTVGTALGVVAGYFGGIAEALTMRAADIMMALPYVLLAVLIAGVLGPSLQTGIIAIGIVRIPRFARLARASTLAVRGLTYIEAAHTIGAPHSRIILREIMPNILGPIAVYATLSLGDAILAAAVLSFLGLGAQPPTPEWGAMLNDAQQYLFSAPYLSILPGVAIFLTVLSFNLIGDGMRDALDPKSKA